MYTFTFEQYDLKKLQTGMPEVLIIEAQYAHAANTIAEQYGVDFNISTWAPVEQADRKTKEPFSTEIREKHFRNEEPRVYKSYTGFIHNDKLVDTHWVIIQEEGKN